MKRRAPRLRNGMQKRFSWNELTMAAHTDADETAGSSGTKFLYGSPATITYELRHAHARSGSDDVSSTKTRKQLERSSTRYGGWTICWKRPRRRPSSPRQCCSLYDEWRPALPPRRITILSVVFRRRLKKAISSPPYVRSRRSLYIHTVDLFSKSIPARCRSSGHRKQRGTTAAAANAGQDAAARRAAAQSPPLLPIVSACSASAWPDRPHRSALSARGHQSEA